MLGVGLGVLIFRQAALIVGLLARKLVLGLCELSGALLILALLLLKLCGSLLPIIEACVVRGESLVVGGNALIIGCLAGVVLSLPCRELVAGGRELLGGGVKLGLLVGELRVPCGDLLVELLLGGVELCHDGDIATIVARSVGVSVRVHERVEILYLISELLGSANILKWLDEICKILGQLGERRVILGRLKLVAQIGKFLA